MSTAWRLICWFESIDWTPEAISAAATVVLATLTFILAFGTVFLWLATKRLVRGTEKTAERQLRAYVGIVNGNLDIEITDKAITARATIRVKNFGQTPAYDAMCKCGIENATTFSEAINSKQISIVGKNTIFPQADQRIMFGNNFVAPPGELPFSTFVFGQISYLDAFGRSRWTNFRFTAHFGPGASRADLAPCEEGNEAN
jgi:hypothetical protein